MEKRKSKPIKIGDVTIGGGFAPVVQGMVKTDLLNTDAALQEIQELQEAGAKLVRIAVPNVKTAKKISFMKERVQVPLAADVHFNYRLALEAMDQGIDKIRVNPGNLSSREILLIAKKAKQKKVPIRIGVNSGSLPKNTLMKISREKGGEEEKFHTTAQEIANVALQCVRTLEKEEFVDILVSLKSSEVPITILSNRIIADKIPYPIHLGVTATGPPPGGVIKSAIGIGSLLSEGIGDTIRVSLTANSLQEVKVAYQILRYLDIFNQGPTLISCPTCGRTRGDVLSIARKVQEVMEEITSPIKIAVMGCEVNGPGEAQDADIGIACTRRGGVLFKKGRLLNKVKRDELFATLVKELRCLDEELRG